MSDEAPKGYHYEWKQDPSWKYDPAKRLCRQVKCSSNAVAAFNRGIRTASGTKDSWWYYCAEHLYGRRIVDGQVLARYMVKNADIAAAVTTAWDAREGNDSRGST